MSFLNTNRVRLTVENLEGRQLLSASPGLALPVKALNAGHVGAVHAPTVQVNHQAPAVAQSASADLVQTLSAVRIYNRTGITRAFYIKWGNGPWTYYSLAPNQSRVITTVNNGFLPSQCRISFDRFSTPGYQERVYTLAVGYAVKTPWTNPVGLARNYSFRPASGGRDLFVGS